jgi:hypothetical protein
MRRCAVCEGFLENSCFSDSEHICKTCISRIQRLSDVDFAVPQTPTVKNGYIQLVIAIKAQAEIDEVHGYSSVRDRDYGGPMAAWKHNWVESEPWSIVWSELEDLGKEYPMHIGGSNADED